MIKFIEERLVILEISENYPAPSPYSIIKFTLNELGYYWEFTITQEGIYDTILKIKFKNEKCYQDFKTYVLPQLAFL